MTLKGLSQYYYIKKEIIDLQERLQELRNSTGSIASPDWSGMPKASNTSSKVEREALKLVELERELENQYIRLYDKKREIEEYIASIDDPLMRLIFRYRFIDCLSWQRVAFKVGGGNTAQSVKMRCYRYIKQNR